MAGQTLTEVAVQVHADTKAMKPEVVAAVVAAVDDHFTRAGR